MDPSQDSQPHSNTNVYMRNPHVSMTDTNERSRGRHVSPKASTYPPLHSDETISTSATPIDAVFSDAEDFSLFAQATAGLGPDSLFLEPEPIKSDHGDDDPDKDEDLLSANPPPQFPVFALPRRPHSPSEPFRSRTPTAVSSQVPRVPSTTNIQRLQTPPQRSASITTESTPLPHPPIDHLVASTAHDPWADDGPPPDDELPDYAASQAQAHASQRAEATRRARELQMRWQQSAYRPRYG